MAPASANSSDQTVPNKKIFPQNKAGILSSTEFQNTIRLQNRSSLTQQEPPDSLTDVMHKPIGYFDSKGNTEATVLSAGVELIVDNIKTSLKKALEVKIEDAPAGNNPSEIFTEHTRVEVPISRTFPSKKVSTDFEISSEKEPEEIAPEIEPEESDMPSITPLSLEQLIAKEKLEGHDAYHVFRLLLLHREDPRLWKFLQEKARNSANFEIFRRNWKKMLILPPDYKKRPLLSPSFIQSVLITGGVREKSKDPRFGYDTSSFTFSGIKLGKGSQGEIIHVLFAEENSQKREDILMLKPALLKKPLNDEIAGEDFQNEQQTAAYFGEIIAANPEDPRRKNLLAPVFIGRNKIVMPMVRDKNGKSLNLNEIGKTGDIKKWAQCLAGAVKGANFASEHGLIDSDLKPDNIVNGEAGGVLIDWGGFLRVEDCKTGKIKLITASDGYTYPVVRTFYHPPHTPSYWSGSLISRELMGEVPPGTFHKFGFYRIIERYFLRNKKAFINPSEYSKLSENQKLNYPPLQIDPLTLSPGEILLYELYKKLNQSHHHPHRFKNNDTKQGIDPDYISTGEVVDRLEEIANMSGESEELITK